MLTYALRFVARFAVLSLALVCYGSVPSTANVQSEYEAQLQEEILSCTGARCELRNRLRGAAQCRAVTIAASFGQLACRRSYGHATLDSAAPPLSLGLVLPLRC
jgi:hypothetical protein